MRFIEKIFGFVLTNLCFNRVVVEAQQLHRIYLQPPVTKVPVLTSATDTDSQKLRNDTMNLFDTTKPTICANGLWALYNQTKFGEGNEAATKVLTMKGLPGALCAPLASYPDLKLVKSAQYLGNFDLNNDGLSIFPETNFLGPRSDIALSALKDLVLPNSLRLGSLAINGNNGVWKLCPDKDCKDPKANVCIDMTDQSKGTSYFMIKDVQNDKTVKWPIYVRSIKDGVSAEECSGAAARLTATTRIDAGGRGLLISKL